MTQKNTRAKAVFKHDPHHVDEILNLEKKDFFNIAGTAHLKSSSFKIQELNYIKKLNNDATLNFDIDFLLS